MRKLKQQGHFAFGLTLMIFAVTASCKEATIPSDTSSCYEQVHSVADREFTNASDGAKAIAGAYQQYCSHLQTLKSLEKVSAESIDLLFRTAGTIEFYSHEERWVSDMRTDLSMLSKKGAASKLDAKDFYHALIDVRDFRQARAFYATQTGAGFLPLPPVDESPSLIGSSRTVLAIDEKRHRLVHQASPARDDYILVVGSPYCHFTQHAVRDIEGDAALRDIFQRNSVWIAPQTGTVAEDFADFAQWNLDHPSAKLSFVFKEAQWQMVDIWSTPIFYFIQNGRVKKKIVGWSDEGNNKEILAAASELGFR